MVIAIACALIILALSSSRSYLPLFMTTGATEGGAVLSVRDLTVRFEKLLAVDHVSFDLGPGTLLGLIGPNGAGKTTLLRAIAQLQPSSGTVTLLGDRVYAGGTEELRQIGFTPDNPPVYEGLTVRQFLQFIGRGYDVPLDEIEERIDFWLEKVWLTEKADQKIKALSRGMRQRIGIARTLLANPAVVLLDEPAAGLDPAGRVQFRQLLSNLRDQGKVLIVSSHILSDMQEYCSHVAIMSAGRIMQKGTVAEVAAQADGSVCRYSVALASPMPEGILRDLIARVEGAENLQMNHASFTIDYSSDRVRACQLLQKLVQSGVQVSAFTPLEADLEQAYLRTGIRQVD